MSDLISAPENVPPVFANGFRIHLEKVRGNGVILTAQPGKSPDQPLKQADISEDAVREELERILESQEFKNKAMLSGFLSHVVEETLAGRSHEIKGYTIATQVFGRRKDFDPTIDPIVRIQAGRLRRTLESYYANGGKQDQLKIEIGKGTYVPNFSLLIPEKAPMEQFQQAAAWPPEDREISQQSQEVFRFTVEEGPSIAVMPLINLTNVPNQEYLALGLTEELTNELARCPGLKVKSSLSLTQCTGKPIETGRVWQEMGVNFFLEGSIRTDEQTIKFTLRLIDTATLVQIWGEQFKHDLGRNRLIDLQEEIARTVAGKIGELFGAAPQTPAKESHETSDTGN